ncbi:diacylglycerol kinase family protein [Streptacidiphilus sp. EB129]|uniref:diacylglycerol kinase family protein n=1 Tax=Streptacidiphilus sp. EB129 TaxID=3156262 RepID=UPI00351256A1
MSAARSAGEALLVVVSPAALALDGESVRVARDVLGAAFDLKAVVPGDLAELRRVLSRRGRKRLVVIGDDHALHHVVQVLHQQSELASVAVAIIPVGKGHKVALARTLGAAELPVDAARAVVHGAERSLDLLVDESGGVVLGGLQIHGRGLPAESSTPTAGTEEPQVGTAAPAVSPAGTGGPEEDRANSAVRSLRANRAAPGRSTAASAARDHSWCTRLLGAARSTRSVVGALMPGPRPDPGQPLRVEADGRLLADVDHPVRLVSAWNACTGTAALVTLPDDGLMDILVSASATDRGALRVQAQRITVSTGPAHRFTYEADHTVSAPVQQRTWTVEPGAWRLTVPPAA